MRKAEEADGLAIKEKIDNELETIHILRTSAHFWTFSDPPTQPPANTHCQ